MSALFGLLAIGLLLLFWYDGLRAREAATGAARRECLRADTQFLDGTVVLGRLTLRRSGGRLKLYRQYYFDYTGSGDDRRRGYVCLLGRKIELVELVSTRH